METGEQRKQRCEHINLKGKQEKEDLLNESNEIYNLKENVDVLLSLIDNVKNYSNHIEHSPLRSLLLWHLNAGHARFNGVQRSDIKISNKLKMKLSLIVIIKTLLLMNFSSIVHLEEVQC